MHHQNGTFCVECTVRPAWLGALAGVQSVKQFSELGLAYGGDLKKRIFTYAKRAGVGYTAGKVF
jgi:hypothetical protein